MCVDPPVTTQVINVLHKASINAWGWLKGALIMADRIDQSWVVFECMIKCPSLICIWHDMWLTVNDQWDKRDAGWIQNIGRGDMKKMQGI